MSQALYRKWRPARFDDVIGQEHVTQTLRNAISSGRSGHAYLFCGPRGTGKTTTARLLAKALNCRHETLSERPCNACASCRAIAEGRFLDLIEIDAASNTGVDDIRDLRDKINFAPSEGRFKVYIIDEVHMLSTAAFNALLKTLEEPPPHAKFVLATTEEHKVPMTIKSRCQQFNFRLLTLPEISGRLRWLAQQEQLTVEPAAVDLIARQGAGSIRDAESLLDQLVAAPGDTITLERAQMVLGAASSQIVGDLVDAWSAGDAAGGLHTIHQALASGADVRQFARQMVEYLRHMLLVQAAGDDAPLNLPAEERQRITQQSRQVSRESLIDAVKAFNGAALSASSSWQPQLPLELAFIGLLPHDAPSRATPARSPQPQRQAVSEAPPPAAHKKPAVIAERATAGAGEPSAGAEKPSAGAEEPAVEPEEATTPDRESGAQEAPPAPEPQATAENATPQPTAAPAESRGATLTLGAVQQQWDRMVERVGRHDRNLPALLAVCRPLGVEGNAIVLGFDYAVLKDKFETRPETRELVADTLSQLLGAKCTVRCVVTAQYTPLPDPQPAQQETPAKSGVDKAEFYALAEELGGEVKES